MGTEEWAKNVLDMVKHKMLEKMEELNKEECSNNSEVEAYKNAAKTIYYLMSIEKSGGVK